MSDDESDKHSARTGLPALARLCAERRRVQVDRRGRLLRRGGARAPGRAPARPRRRSSSWSPTRSAPSGSSAISRSSCRAPTRAIRWPRRASCACRPTTPARTPTSRPIAASCSGAWRPCSGSRRARAARCSWPRPRRCAGGWCRAPRSARSSIWSRPSRSSTAIAPSTLLARGGYLRTPVVEDPGTFAVRGGVLDVFPPLYRFPVRIELFGDLVESHALLRSGDAAHAARDRGAVPAPGARDRAHRRRPSCATGCATPPSAPSTPRRRRARSWSRSSAARTSSASRGWRPRSTRGWSRSSSTCRPTRPVFVEEPDACLDAVGARWRTREAHDYAARVAEHSSPSRRGLLPRREPRMRARSPHRGARASSPRHARTSRRRPARPPVGALRAAARRARARAAALARREARGAAAPLRRSLRGARRERRARLARSRRTSSTPIAWRSLLRGHGLRADSAAAPSLRPLARRRRPRGRRSRIGGAARAASTCRSTGWRWSAEREIFGETIDRRRGDRRRRRPASSATLFKNLAPGDYVVHEMHGVGLLPRPDQAAAARTRRRRRAVDFLHLEYDGGTLYLPVYRLGEVQRYVGAEGHAQARQARRRHLGEDARQGLARGPPARRGAAPALRAAAGAARPRASRRPTSLFREFEATFPFDETPDQAAGDRRRARATWRQPRPMDRLVCGDVGYGKTEVALRAAFEGGARRQAGGGARADHGARRAALPTPSRSGCATSRSASASLSRFQSHERADRDGQGARRRARSTSSIGTHRLLSADVRFKDLGPARHRRGAALRRRAQGAAQEAAHPGRRAHADRDADPAHAAHGDGRAARALDHRDAARRSPRDPHVRRRATTTR